MLDTVRQVHIAIDLGLQQINSNRKQAFMPEQYDFLINMEILQYIEDKSDFKSNPKRDGFEDTQRRVDELRDLKKTTTLRFYNDIENRSYTILPSDYYKLLTGGCTIFNHYNKRKLTFNGNTETKYIYLLNFPDDKPLTQGVQVYQNMAITINSNTTYYTKPIYSTSGKFDIIKFYIDYLRKILGVDAYWEQYDGTYYTNSFVIVVSNPFLSTSYLSYTSGFDSSNVNIASTVVEPTYTYNTTTGNVIQSGIELISSKEKRDVLNSKYMNTTRQTHTLATLEGIRLYTYYDNTFLPLNIELSYIFKPRLMDYYYNTMPELTITNEIIERVVNKLKVFIKDEQAYAMFNADLQKVQ